MGLSEESSLFSQKPSALLGRLVPKWATPAWLSELLGGKAQRVTLQAATPASGKGSKGLVGEKGRLGAEGWGQEIPPFQLNLPRLAEDEVPRLL